MKEFHPKEIYYEPAVRDYPQGRELLEKYGAKGLPMTEISSHNRIPELSSRPNADFARLKSFLILATRKTHRYVPNAKVSDYLVPFTSSGCPAMCLYCYLVCTYNKCAYLRVFVNREQMMDRLVKKANEDGPSETFEIGSNSDLVLENAVTGNLPWAVEQFVFRTRKGSITFPTKFHMIEPLLSLEHQGRVIVRVSVNPEDVIRRIELGTSTLTQRIEAVNKLAEAGYRLSLLVAPVILEEGWESRYEGLFAALAEKLSEKAKRKLLLEIIFLTYSFVQGAINGEAFPKAPELYHKGKMAPCGRGKYSYKPPEKREAGRLLRHFAEHYLPECQIVYIV